MNYYNKSTNRIQSTPFPGAFIFPDEFWNVYHMPNKRAAGFVTITDDGTTVTSCAWDEAAYQKWCAENPEHPDTPAAPTTEERLSALEGAVLSMMGVSLNV